MWHDFSPPFRRAVSGVAAARLGPVGFWLLYVMHEWYDWCLFFLAWIFSTGWLFVGFDDLDLFIGLVDGPLNHYWLSLSRCQARSGPRQ